VNHTQNRLLWPKGATSAIGNQPKGYIGPRRFEAFARKVLFSFLSYWLVWVVWSLTGRVDRPDRRATWNKRTKLERT
jgi:hypothetical protein